MGSWIYDRTEADVRNETDKGFVNYTDFNRIESDIAELEDTLNAYGYLLPETLVNKTDWHAQGVLGTSGMENIPTLAHMNRILHNIGVLRSVYRVYPTTPATPATMEFATYQTFNDIEKILYDLWLMLHDTEHFFRECNTFDCGEYDY